MEKNSKNKKGRASNDTKKKPANNAKNSKNSKQNNKENKQKRAEFERKKLENIKESFKNKELLPEDLNKSQSNFNLKSESEK